MRKSANVLEILDKNTARVMLYKHKKCSGCGSCNKHMHPGSIFPAHNQVQAKAGDIVDVNVKKAFSITEFLMVYVLPTVLFITGLLLGSVVFTGEKGEIISVGFAFFLLLISIVFNIIYKKNYNPVYSVSIVKRILPAEPRLK